MQANSNKKILHRLLATTITSVTQELPFKCKLLASGKLLCAGVPMFFPCTCCWPTTAQEVGEEPWRANGREREREWKTRMAPY